MQEWLAQTDANPILAGNCPLCVDLDGTLVRTDVLVESFFALLKQHIGYAVLAPFWLLKGKAYFKHQVAERVELDVSVLPYHEPLLDYLREQHRLGRRLVLATASHVKFASKISEHLGLFDEVIASDAESNFSGVTKLERLQERFGGKGFDYAGNSDSDLEIWRHARRAILVNAPPAARSIIGGDARVEAEFVDTSEGLKGYLRAMRVHQWLKNLLVFAPLVADHQVTNLPLLLQATAGFLAFCLCASSVYILNDLLDLTVDRYHPRKHQRPFAAGTLSIKKGALLFPMLLLAAFGIALMLPAIYLVVLGTYYVSTLAYSFWLKEKIAIDVVVLAALYTLRIIAGGAAVTIPPSFWLLAFSMFVFLSLAMVKRYSELLSIRDFTKKPTGARGDYSASDLDMFKCLGAASGYLAVLVLALYVNSEEIKSEYTHPQLIWLLCPLLLYWMSLVWITTGRGNMYDDPVVFAIRNRGSQRAAILGIILYLLAS